MIKVRKGMEAKEEGKKRVERDGENMQEKLRDAPFSSVHSLHASIAFKPKNCLSEDLLFKK